ncbi:MAG TPA: histidine--tRNA ligase [Candidatus Magasanikbacteria bacterium]|nr:histidine--tRNA ligase [Candidatus Magasanikbacteria bacterium]
MPTKNKKTFNKKSPDKKIKKKNVEKKVVAPKKIENRTENHAEEKNNDEVVEGIKTGKGKVLSLLRGFKDILPKEDNFWKVIRHSAENLADAYNYKWIETPILEEASLFIRSIGKGTDVVDKEMYVFEDADGDKICLRPESTASIARAYVLHGMHTMPQPVKVWYLGPMFRHDRPQAGRYREFHQFGCESLGVKDPVVDAELIAVAYYFLKDLNINSIVYINSIGTVADRQNYIVELVGYLRAKRSYLCEECKKRINKNPLRVLDCKNPDCKTILEEVPQIIDWLSDESRNFFMKVLEYLDDLNIPYELKPTLVRGLDYYTDTVFELYKENGEEGAQSALGGGGRYDGLVAELGSKEIVPGCGFSLGLERVVNVLKEQQQASGTEYQETNKFFFAQLGEQARRKTLKVLEELRLNGIIVKHNLAKSALKAQLELANKYKADYTLILGQKEVQDGTIIIRDMESGIQEIIDQKKLVPALKKKLEKMN